jgi:hypothetical protein
MKNIFCIHPLFLYSFRSDRIIDLVILWGIIILIYIFLTWGDPFFYDRYHKKNDHKPNGK